MLSAQCTDQRVNIVTVELFKTYRTAQDYANADPSALEQAIRSITFFRSKAKNIIRCCQAIVEKHNGTVPSTMEELTQLAGVGRKTANCVLNSAFHNPSGIVVDTHVMRVAGRLRLSKGENTEKIEQDLMLMFPKEEWIDVGNLLLLLGRHICMAKKPACDECPLQEQCPSAFKIATSTTKKHR
jgi:endonuclease-3